MNDIYTITHFITDASGKLNPSEFYKTKYHQLDEWNIEEGTIAQELGKAGTFKCQLSPANKAYDTFTKYSSYIMVERYNDIVYTGRVSDESKDLYNTQIIECEGLLSLFCDILFPIVTEERGNLADWNLTLSEWIDKLCSELRNQSILNSEQTQYRSGDYFKTHMLAGTNGSDSTEKWAYESSSYTNGINILETLAEEYDGYFNVRVEKTSSASSPYNLYLDFKENEKEDNNSSGGGSSTPQSTKDSGSWPYWVYVGSGWDVSTQGSWTVTVNRPVGSNTAIIIAKIKMVSPGGQTAPWRLTLTINGETYEEVNSNTHWPGEETVLSKEVKITVPDTENTISGSIKFSVDGYSDFYKQASWSCKCKAKGGDNKTANTSKAEINFGDNLIDLKQESNMDDVYTVLYPIGKEGLTPHDMDSTKKDYVLNSDAFSLYGNLPTTETYDNCDTADSLISAAQKDIDKKCKPKVKITIKCVDLKGIIEDTDSIRLGDKIRVKSVLNNIDDFFIVKNQDIDVLDPTNDELSMENEKSGYISKTRKIEKSFEQRITEAKENIVELEEQTIVNIIVDYTQSNDPVNHPTDSANWSIVPPTRIVANYIWMRTRYFRPKATAPYNTTYVCVTGDRGDDGPTITQTISHFLATDLDSGVTIDTPGWSTDENEQRISPEKPYLWVYISFEKSDGSESHTEPVIQGVYGDFIQTRTLYYMLTSTSIKPSILDEHWGTTELLPTFTQKYLWVKQVDTYFSGSTVTDIYLRTVYGDDGSSVVSMNYYWGASDSISLGNREEIDEWHDDISTVTLTTAMPYLYSYYLVTYSNGMVSEPSIPIYIYRTNLASETFDSAICHYIGVDKDTITVEATETGWSNPKNESYIPSEGWVTDPSKVQINESVRYLWGWFELIKNSLSTIQNPQLIRSFGSQITGLDRQYYVSTSSSELTGGEWLEECPDPTTFTNSYIWTRTRMTFGNAVNYSEPQLLSYVNYITSKTVNIDGELANIQTTIRDLGNGVTAITQKTEQYDATLGTLSDTVSELQTSSQEYSLFFANMGEGLRQYFRFDASGFYISDSDTEGSMTTRFTNEGYEIKDATDIVQLKVTRNGVNMHTAYINDSIQFNYNDIGKWRIVMNDDFDLSFEWMGG